MAMLIFFTFEYEFKYVHLSLSLFIDIMQKSKALHYPSGKHLISYRPHRQANQADVAHCK